MKKRFIKALSSLLVSACFITSGCGLKSIRDDLPAIVEITTSGGYAMVSTSSYNGLGKWQSGSEQASNNAFRHKLGSEETINIHFFCDACGHDEKVETTAPVALMLSCDCPENGDRRSNAKEYFCIIIQSTNENE